MAPTAEVTSLLLRALSDAENELDDAYTALQDTEAVAYKQQRRLELLREVGRALQALQEFDNDESPGGV